MRLTLRHSRSRKRVFKKLISVIFYRPTKVFNCLTSFVIRVHGLAKKPSYDCHGDDNGSFVVTLGNLLPVEFIILTPALHQGKNAGFFICADPLDSISRAIKSLFSLNGSIVFFLHLWIMLFFGA